MSDDSSFTAPCSQVNDQGHRCLISSTYTDGLEEEHEHQFPTVISREQIDLTETYGKIIQRVPVGGGHELLIMGDNCIRFAHDCNRALRFPDRPILPLRIAPALQFGNHRPSTGPVHIVTVVDSALGFPTIDVDPSIECSDCGTHGFVRNGKWVDA